MSSFSGRSGAGIRKVRLCILIVLIISQLCLAFSSSQTDVIAKQARRAVSSFTDTLRDSLRTFKTDRPAVDARKIKRITQLESEVSKINLCPRRLLLYVGDESMLSPLPLDSSSQPAHGVTFSWQTSDPTIADVASDGTVKGVKSGQCIVTASVGLSHAKVNVEVRQGLRPRLTNAQWDVEHTTDCDDPEQDPVALPKNQAMSPNSRRIDQPPYGLQLAPPPDPDEPPNVPAAGARFNATGHPRFSPDLSTMNTGNQLGSSSFSLSVPIFGSGGRGIGVDPVLVYNSRMWTKNPNTSQIVFDYDGGWPAPGFRLNYGRIIPNYNVAPGATGNYLLIEADGTRTPLINQGSNLYRSEDGRYIEFNADSSKLLLPNGTTIKYDTPNGSKLLPIRIKDIHGNSINIAYVFNCADALRVESCACGTNCSRPPRQAIKQITDTLGRIVTFHYYANGHLAEIRAPGYNGGADRIIAKFSYTTITLSYDFSPTVSGVPANGQVDVLKRVYFPETGRGYVFDNYSAYGMCAKVSKRLGMTDALDGTEVEYTEYIFNTSGELADAPTFTERREWWQGKTDDAGNSTSLPATFTYSRTSNSTTLTNTITGPNNIATVMISNNETNSPQFGMLSEIRNEIGGVMKSKQEFSYDNPSSSSGSSGLQRNKIITTDDGSTAKQTRVDFNYGSYGRLTASIEYGFPVLGTFKKRRRTVYTYMDTPSYITAGLYHLVTDITVWDAKLSNMNEDDEEVARAGFEYDSPGMGWEIVKYGFTNNCSPPACSPPPGYDTSFVNNTVRGLVTRRLRWSNAKGSHTSGAAADISFRHQYDLFGNEVKAELSCCSLKRFSFAAGIAGMHYSVAQSVIDGAISGPTLTNSFEYDFNTGFLKSQTDPNGLVTSYAPDAAMRIGTVTLPKLSTDTDPNPMIETFFADPNYPGKDGLVYQTKLNYKEGTTQKTQTTIQWFDGAGHVLRTGIGSGASPTSFDAIKSIYDEFGRVRKTTNPYNTTASNGDTSGLPLATIYDYDSQSRVTTITLPDSNTITTAYNGAVTTETDQVGRQRQYEADGLGRTIRVTEMNSAKQLTQHTTYEYDLNNNLILINQGNQTRTFKYDSLSRMTFERTPEQDATINDGTGAMWSAKYTYTAFGAIATREDSRQVKAIYSYDGINRPSGVSYDVSSTNPAIAATPAVTVSYGTTAPELGQIKTITDSVGTESYSYDGLSRVQSKIRSIDSRNYATSYQYNQAGQLTRVTYPSSRQVDIGHDARGRLFSLGGTRSYMTSVTYKPSQQVDAMQFANGITETYGYSAERLQLTSQTIKRGTNTPVMSMTYNYNADSSSGGGTQAGNSGQLMSLTATINGQNRDQSFKYDEVERLTYASGKDASGQQWQRRYSYDRWGNRTKVEQWAQSFIPGVFDWCAKQFTFYNRNASGVPTTNRVIEVDTIDECDATTVAQVQYDSAGNETHDNQYSYAYDAEGRVVKVTGLSSDVPNQYWYDASNRRVKKVTATNQTIHYIWEGGRVIAEHNGASGALIAEYVYAGGRMIAQESGTTVRYLHQDLLSVRMMTDGAGNWVGTQSHEPFGEEVAENGEVNKHRFTTYERDAESESDYAVNRQYAGKIGRFTRPDPIAGNIGNPQSLNRYAYAGNDPVNGVDPLGLLVCFRYHWEGGSGSGWSDWTCLNDEPSAGDSAGSEEAGDTGGSGSGKEQRDIATACARMAQRAQELANRALKLAWSGHVDYEKALRLFDVSFSQEYLGSNGPGPTYKSALEFYNNRNENMKKRTVPQDYQGQTGFLAVFKEPYADDNKNDQTHHFAAYLSFGINNQEGFAALHALTDPEGEPDRYLGITAYGLGNLLRNDPTNLQKVGELVRGFCE